MKKSFIEYDETGLVIQVHTNVVLLTTDEEVGKGGPFGDYHDPDSTLVLVDGEGWYPDHQYWPGGDPTGYFKLNTSVAGHLEEIETDSLHPDFYKAANAATRLIKVLQNGGLVQLPGGVTLDHPSEIHIDTLNGTVHVDSICIYEGGDQRYATLKKRLEGINVFKKEKAW